MARFLPSLTDLAFLFPLIVLFLKLKGARTLLGDGDTGWHVRTGEWILAHHAVPRVDMFSFSRPGAPWFAWEWLWDVAFAILHMRWGMGAVVFVSIVVICLTTALTFRLARRKCGNGLVAIAVTLLATGGCAIHWLARPHLFSLLFFVISLHIADRAYGTQTREGNTRLLWWLVPLTALWTNVHGGVFFVFLVLASYIGGDLLNAVLEKESAARSGCCGERGQWSAIALACFAATFINPYGWHLHQHVLAYISDPYQLQHIAEFQGIDFHSPVVVYFEPLMLGALLAAFWDARHRRFADVFLSLGWLHLALIAQRNIPLFAIAAAPIVARAAVAAIDAARQSPLAAWISRSADFFTHFSAGFDVNDRIGRVYAASVVPLALACLLLLSPVPASDLFRSTYDPHFYPEKALPLLLEPATHHIFTDDEWGDYLVYQLYPHKKVFIDGRSDFYGDQFGERYLDLINVKYDWEKTLDDYQIDTIVISPRFALSSTLKISPLWRTVHDDGVSLVFRRANSSGTGSSEASRAGGEPASLVSSNAGFTRDHSIAKTNNRGPRATQQPTT